MTAWWKGISPAELALSHPKPPLWGERNGQFGWREPRSTRGVQSYGGLGLWYLESSLPRPKGQGTVRLKKVLQMTPLSRSRTRKTIILPTTSRSAMCTPIIRGEGRSGRIPIPLVYA